MASTAEGGKVTFLREGCHLVERLRDRVFDSRRSAYIAGCTTLTALALTGPRTKRRVSGGQALSWSAFSLRITRASRP